MDYPKSLEENLEFRTNLIQLCEKDISCAADTKWMFENDILFAFNVFFWTYDPRSVKKDLPFITYPFQDKTILEINDAIEHGENVFIDKSRDMGATYMVVYVFLWRFLTKKGEEFRIGSRKEDFVDTKGDMDSLFEKMRYCLKLLPRFLLPKGSIFKNHFDLNMRMLNIEKRCSIIGEATNINFGRGGRKKAILFDEFQEWEDGSAAWEACSDATNCKIALGTAHGAGNKFAELSRSDEVKNKLHLMWWEHPLKAHTSPEYLQRLIKKEIVVKGRKLELNGDQSNAPSGTYIDMLGRIRSEWYDTQEEKRTERDVRENLDCDYLTSGQPIFDTFIVKGKKNLCKSPEFVGTLEWKVSPAYDEQGFIKNFDHLQVEFVNNMNGWLKVWKKPEIGYSNAYCISADVAEGLEKGDYDSASVLNRISDKPEIVATIHGKMKTFEYAERLAMLGLWYGKAIIAPERNNTMGGAVLEQLFKIYRFIYHKDIFSKGYAERSDSLGWLTTTNKGMIIGNLSKMISNDEFIDNDEGFWNECLIFVNNDGSLEAQGSGFDDRVMDRAILLWINQRLPLPTVIREKIIHKGWRSDWNKQQMQDKQLVGWV